MFVSRETQDRIDRLEAEKESLSKQLVELQTEVGHRSKANPSLATLGWILFILAAVVAVYALFFRNISNSSNQASILTKEGLVMRDVTSDTTIVYHVQIGAFESFDLKPHAESLENIYTFENDSLTRITLGKFYDLTEAQSFLSDLVKLKLEFAYITAYEKGIPIGLMEAMGKNNEAQP